MANDSGAAVVSVDFFGVSVELPQAHEARARAKTPAKIPNFEADRFIANSPFTKLSGYTLYPHK